MQAFAKLTEKGRTTMREMRSVPTSYGLIHADFHAGNYLFYKGSVRFIDFEDLSWGRWTALSCFVLSCFLLLHMIK